MIDVRVRVFEPWALKGRVLPAFLSLDWSGKVNDHSVLTVQVERGSLSEEILEGEKEVAVEVQTSGAWFEPYGCRFRSTTSKVDLVKSAATREFSFIGISTVLRDALVWEATPGDKEGKRVFAAQSPGKMLGSLLREAKRRSGGGRAWAAGLAWSFTDSHDSAGQGWGKNASNSFVPTATLMKVLEWLTSKGAVDWRMNGRELQLFKSGGEMARELGVPLRPAFASSVPVSTTSENLVTTALMRGKDGKRWTRESREAVSAFGRIEVGVDQGQVELNETAALHMDARLKSGMAPARQYRREWALPQDGAPLLWVDYQVGDWVDVAGESLRVVEAGVKVDEKGAITGWETLGTRIDSLVERLARRTTDLSDGMVGGENSPVSVDIGPDTEKGIPAAPTGLLVSSDAVDNGDGSHASVVTISWEPVTSTVEGRPVTVVEYQARVVENGQATFDLQAVEARLSRAGYPGSRWRVQVRAQSKQGVWGEWSTTVDHILARDKVPPPKPQPPTLSNELGILRVTHSGLASSGAGMPADVERWQVAVSESKTANPSPDGTVADAGGLTWHKAGLTPGKRYYVRVRAIDSSGNVGPWSEAAEGTVSKVFDDEALRKEIRNGTIIGPGAIKTPHLASLSVGTDQLKANAITGGKMQVGALDGFIITGATVQTSRTANAGVKMNADGIFAYDSDGYKTVSITGQGGYISGYTIRGGVIESSGAWGKVRIREGRVSILNGEQEQLVLDDDGLYIKEGSRVIGRISSQPKKDAPHVRGLSMSLENSGDYISWGFRQTEEADAYTVMLGLDPKGLFYPGEPGIHAAAPLWLSSLKTSSGEVAFGNFTVNGQGTWPSLWRGKSGVLFGSSDLWISTGGSAWNMTEMLNKLNQL